MLLSGSSGINTLDAKYFIGECSIFDKLLIGVLPFYSYIISSETQYSDPTLPAGDLSSLDHGLAAKGSDHSTDVADSEFAIASVAPIAL